MSEENKFGGGEDPTGETRPDPEEFDGFFADEELEEDESAEKETPFYFEEPPADTEVIGVRFRTSAKVYYFDPDGKTYKDGCHAIVETARGQEYGLVTQGNHVVPGREIVLPLRKALRVATPDDDARDESNREKAEEAFAIGTKKIEEHGLEMKLIETEYTFDNSKLLFYFTSEGRVDFRELVKDLASVFRCRIELRQMGIRDEAKILGGLGICGRPFCCHVFLPDFVQVSIKMAKEQNLALNSAKISGACGRLMCCLRYEYDAYLEEGRMTPKVDSLVNTPDGIGVVVEAKPLVGMVKVKSLDDSSGAPRVYHRDQLTPIKKGDDNYERAMEEKSLEKQARAAGTTRAALKAARSETPEQAAERAAKAERQLRAQRAEPKRAASYTGQVTPLALQGGEKSRLEPPQDVSPENAPETKAERPARNRNDRRSNQRKKNKGQRNEQRSERPESAEIKPPRYEKIPRSERPESAPAAGRQESGAAEGKASAHEEPKKSRRPFRHYKKNGKGKPGQTEKN